MSSPSSSQVWRRWWWTIGVLLVAVVPDSGAYNKAVPPHFQMEPLLTPHARRAGGETTNFAERIHIREFRRKGDPKPSAASGGIDDTGSSMDMGVPAVARPSMRFSGKMQAAMTRQTDAVEATSTSKTHARAKERLYHKEGPPMPCMGLTSALCHPCERYGGPPPYCMEAAGQQCAFAFCHPMCLRLTWRVRVVVTKPGPTPTFAGEVAGPHVQEAIKAQFKAYGCVMMACCDPKLIWDYVENYVYHANYGEPYIPLHSCQHDPTDPDVSEAYCDACKQSVKVKAEVLDCTPDLTAKANADKDFLEIDSVLTKTAPPRTGAQFNRYWDPDDISSYYDSVRKHAAGIKPYRHIIASTPPPPPSASSSSSSSASPPTPSRRPALSHESSFVLESERIRLQMSEMRERLMVGYDPGMKQGVHHTFYDRCIKLKEAVEGQLSGLVADFQGKVCGCFGCCEDLCYYPTTINTPKQLGDISYPTTSDMAAGWEPIEDESDEEHYIANTTPN